MTAVTQYPAIASMFAQAVAEPDRPQVLRGAIAAMQEFPEVCARIRCFNDTIWEIVADTLNAGVPIKNTEAFEHACALLEALEKEAP